MGRWNEQARRNSLQKRRDKAARQLRYTAVILRRVEAVGGGVARACRVLDLVRSKRIKRRGQWVKARWQRAEVLRIARAAGVDLSQGRRFVPGQGGFRQICYRCFADLSASPWCACLPGPPAGMYGHQMAYEWFISAGIEGRQTDMHRGGGGPQQRLKKWRESLRGYKPVVSARVAQHLREGENQGSTARGAE